MALIAVKCTQCDATIQIEYEQKQATCQFCQTNFLVPKGLDRMIVSGTAKNVTEEEIERLLKEANESLHERDGEGTLETVTKVLSIDPTNFRAWRLKTIGLGMTATLEQTNIEGILTSGQNAITYTPKDRKQVTEKIIYTYYGKVCKAYAEKALAHVKTWSALAPDEKIAGVHHHTENCLKHINKPLADALRLREAIPNHFFEALPDLAATIVAASEQVTEMFDIIFQERIAAENYHISAEEKEAYDAYTFPWIEKLTTYQLELVAPIKGEVTDLIKEVAPAENVATQEEEKLTFSSCLILLIFFLIVGVIIYFIGVFILWLFRVLF